MGGPFDSARDSIELRLTLNVILGYLEESVAEVWKDAINKLDDREIAYLARVTQKHPIHEVSRMMLRYLMQKSYPFKEMILYRTDEDFKRRLGLNQVGE